jgi:hypothetical protein
VEALGPSVERVSIVDNPVCQLNSEDSLRSYLSAIAPNVLYLNEVPISPITADPIPVVGEEEEHVPSNRGTPTRGILKKTEGISIEHGGNTSSSGNGNGSGIRQDRKQDDSTSTHHHHSSPVADRDGNRKKSRSHSVQYGSPRDDRSGTGTGTGADDSGGDRIGKVTSPLRASFSRIGMNSSPASGGMSVSVLSPARRGDARALSESPPPGAFASLSISAPLLPKPGAALMNKHSDAGSQGLTEASFYAAVDTVLKDIIFETIESARSAAQKN